MARRLAPRTVKRFGITLDIWERWLKETYPNQVLDPSLLTRSLLGQFHDDLLRSGQKGERKPGTVQLYLSVIHGMWEWAEDDEAYEEFMPRPRRLRLSSPPTKYPTAPTWEQMDAVIGTLKGPYRRLAILMRFTGLRPSQAARLRWDDLRPDLLRLEIRGELGKSRQERTGRVIPISPHLLACLEGWERPHSLITHTTPNRGVSQRGLPLVMRRAWARAGAPPAVYEGAPNKAFRRGFQSELKRLGADDEAVKFLVGHSRSLRGHYVDPWYLPTLEAVELIPPLQGA